MQRQGNWIAGEWRDGSGEVPSLNPSDLGDTVGIFAQASAADLDDAVTAARSAQKLWAEVGLERRAAVLERIGRELTERQAELGRLLSREEGKTLPEGIGEVGRAGAFFSYFAAEILRSPGRAGPSVRDGIEVVLTREPMGVVAVITPWNFPIATASWKIAPALAFGNAVLWKPANLTPAIAWALTEIVARQDVPKGLFSLVAGPGHATGQALAGHPGIDALSFTGSEPVGRDIAAAASRNLTRFGLELGSKNALLVCQDADLDLAVRCAMVGGFSGTGQKCTASARLVVEGGVHDAFVEKLVAAARALKVGPALDPASQMGPLASEAQLKTTQDYLDLARNEGCTLAFGGEPVRCGTPGHYLSPAVLTGGASRMRTNQEEIFGPVVCTIRVNSFDEGLAVVNDTQYGLSAAVATRSLARAGEFRRRVEAGCAMVNLPTSGTDYHFPFTGRKRSSFGPGEQAGAAVEFYTQSKTSYIFGGPTP